MLDIELFISFTFLLSLAPSVGPTPTITWLSNSKMNVSWTPLTLEEARGFLTGYTVTYASIGRKKRQIEEGERMVAANESFVVLDGLNASQRQYLISVLGVNSAGSGVSSTRVNAPTSKPLLITIATITKVGVIKIFKNFCILFYLAFSYLIPTLCIINDFPPH